MFSSYTNLTIKSATKRPLQIHLSLPILLLWILMEDMVISTVVLDSISLILVFLFSLSIHELGHSLVLQSHKVITNSLTLFPSGIFYRIKSTNAPFSILLSSLAGPACNLVVGLSTVLVNEYLNPGLGLKFDSSILSLIIYCNLALGLINFLPLFPFDGYIAAGALCRLLRIRNFSSAMNKIIMLTAAALLGTLYIFASSIFLLLLILLFLVNARELFRIRVLESSHSMQILEVTTETSNLVSLPHSLTRTMAFPLVAKSLQPLIPVLHGNSLCGVIDRETFLREFATSAQDDYIASSVIKDLPVLNSSDLLYPILEQNFDDVKACFIVKSNEGSFIGLFVPERAIEYIILGKIAENTKAGEVSDEFWL